MMQNVIDLALQLLRQSVAMRRVWISLG